MTLRKKTRLIFSMVLTGLFGVVYGSCATILLGKLRKAEEQNTPGCWEFWVFLLKPKMTLVLLC